MLQIILAEDHNIVRNGIRMLLETDQGINVAAEAINGNEVLEYLNSGGLADVVLADINMPEMDGIALLKALKSNYTDIKVIMLSMHDHEKYINQAFSAGADAYMLKNVSAEELIFSIKHVQAGGRYLCAELSLRILDKFVLQGYHPETHGPSDIDFSSREIEVLHLIADGLTNTEMSDKLFISKRTIEGHRQNLIEKTESRNTAALIRYAVLHGLIH